jgi:hypothetical protein
MMGEHRPPPLQCLGRDAWAELRNLALEVCADEVFSPTQAGCVVGREQTVGESSADPEPVQLGLADLCDVERRELGNRVNLHRCFRFARLDRGSAHRPSAREPHSRRLALVQLSR